MNEPMATSPTESATSDTPGPDDARFGFAKVTEIIGNLIEDTPADSYRKPTPCPEFAVQDVIEHLIMVMSRVAAIGQGSHWSDIEQEQRDGGWSEAFRSAAHDVMKAWTDPAKLAQMYEVPWGEMPGAPLLHTYTAELAVHAWDLATATDRDLTIDDSVLEGPWIAAQFLPAEGRDSEEMPFDPVVDPGEDAPLLLKISGWMGRQVG